MDCIEYFHFPIFFSLVLFVLRAPELVNVFDVFFLKVNLSMTGGSCLWEAVVNDSRVAEVIRPPSGLQCSQMMLCPKGLGTTLVTVYDIGVSPPLSAPAVVSCYFRVIRLHKLVEFH